MNIHYYEICMQTFAVLCISYIERNIILRSYSKFCMSNNSHYCNSLQYFVQISNQTIVILKTRKNEAFFQLGLAALAVQSHLFVTSYDVTVPFT
jgi:hypothetical protein